MTGNATSYRLSVLVHAVDAASGSIHYASLAWEVSAQFLCSLFVFDVFNNPMPDFARMPILLLFFFAVTFTSLPDAGKLLRTAAPDTHQNFGKDIKMSIS